MRYNLDQRCLTFAKSIRSLSTAISKTLENGEYRKQIIRSSGSIGANYIEANEALSSKDFIMRLKIARKEAKETYYWLQLIVTDEQSTKERDKLSQESNELIKILYQIILNCT